MSVTPVAEFNPEIAGTFVEPGYFDALARLRREEPVRQYAAHSWTVARYDDVRAVSRDPELFCSGRGVLMHDPMREGKPISGSILHMDPPTHGPWRGLVTRRFTPRAIGGLEERVRSVARSVLDAIPGGAEIDFVDAVAAPFPVLVIAELLGVDGADRDHFRRWSDAAIEAPDRGDEQFDDLTALFEFFARHIAARREHPSDDIVSAVVHAEVEGAPLTTQEAVVYLMALLVAGNETTRHLVSGGAAALAEHPEQRALLAREPARIGSAVEECLRWVTPVQAFGRTATRDTELRGVPIDAGDWVVMLYASANRDEDAFGPTSGVFDVTRPIDAQHVAFGFGEHLCVGASLARLEGRVLFEELLARFPDYALTAEPELTRSTLVRGATRMPVVCR
jgi:cytochrome P450